MKTVDLGAPVTQNRALLIHSIWGGGKTHILGSCLVDSVKKGLRVCALHIDGEPALSTLGKFPLQGVDIITLEKVEDFPLWAKETEPYDLCGLDSLFALGEMAISKVTKDTHAPGATEKGAGRDGRAEWGMIKYEIDKAVTIVRRHCRFLVAVAPSRRHENEITGTERTVPDLPGRSSEAIAGRFDYVGYLEAVVLSPEKTNRLLSFHLRTDALTRCNVPNPPTKAIVVPAGLDCWAGIRAALIGGE